MSCPGHMGFPNHVVNGTRDSGCITWKEDPACVNVQPMPGHEILLYSDCNCRGKLTLAKDKPTDYDGELARSFKVNRLE